MVRTFLVEDRPLIRENLIEALAELADAKVVGWASGVDEAIWWLRQPSSVWTLAVIDLFLAQGSGMEVLKALRHRAASAKVVVLTNYATADVRRLCSKLGADAVFDKSNELDALMAYCRKCRLSML